MIGDIEDIGRLFGWIKLTSDGANPNPFDIPGVEKSSISSFQTMPNSGDCTTAPNQRLTVEVADTPLPSASRTLTCDVP